MVDRIVKFTFLSNTFIEVSVWHVNAWASAQKGNRRGKGMWGKAT